MTVAQQKIQLSVKSERSPFAQASGGAPCRDGVSFDIMPGEQVGIVGESALENLCPMLAAMGLLPNSARIEADHIRHEMARTQSLRGKPHGGIARRLKSHGLSENPMTSLNIHADRRQSRNRSQVFHDKSVTRNTFGCVGDQNAGGSEGFQIHHSGHTISARIFPVVCVAPSDRPHGPCRRTSGSGADRNRQRLWNVHRSARRSSVVLRELSAQAQWSASNCHNHDSGAWSAEHRGNAGYGS